VSHKLDIFETLSAIDRRDMTFYERLDDEQRKGFAPPVVLRWASAVTDGNMSEYMMWLVNERANINFHDIWRHPELQSKLLASCGHGRQQRHRWVPMAKSGKKADKVYDFLRQFWPEANDTEVGILFGQFTDDTFEDFVLSSGSTPEEVKEVMDAYARLVGKKVSSKKASKKR